VPGMRRLPRAVLAVSVGLALSGLAACATPSAPVPPLYTPAEERAQCERHGGWWHLDDLRGDYCEPNSQM
jgi:hypothetical protein